MVATLMVCPGCSRHVRFGETSCPFCGANVSGVMRVSEYRVTNRLNRGHIFSFGAALAAAGFAVSCDETVAPPYGIACTPTTCNPDGGRSGGPSHGGAGSGTVTSGGTAGRGGTAGNGATGSGGAAPGGTGGARAGAGGSTDGGASGNGPGGAAGAAAGGDDSGGSAGDGGAGGAP